MCLTHKPKNNNIFNNNMCLIINFNPGKALLQYRHRNIVYFAFSYFKHLLMFF